MVKDNTSVISTTGGQNRTEQNRTETKQLSYAQLEPKCSRPSEELLAVTHN